MLPTFDPRWPGPSCQVLKTRQCVPIPLLLIQRVGIKGVLSWYQRPLMTTTLTLCSLTANQLDHNSRIWLSRLAAFVCVFRICAWVSGWPWSLADRNTNLLTRQEQMASLLAFRLYCLDSHGIWCCMSLFPQASKDSSYLRILQFYKAAASLSLRLLILVPIFYSSSSIFNLSMWFCSVILGKYIMR